MSLQVSALGLCVAVALGACGSSANTPTSGSIYASCTDVDASAVCTTDGSTFEAVQPILARSCLPACHDNSPDANWPLTDFDDVQAWTNFISEDLVRCTMPPANSGTPMSREDRATILNWIVCGAPP